MNKLVPEYFINLICVNIYVPAQKFDFVIINFLMTY